MPVKPSIPVTVRASALNYVGGPVALQGTPTKIARPGADMAEGHWVDSPLGTYPVTAQSRNFEENRNDAYIEWLSLGSSQNDPDAHVVETDSSGDINVVGVNCSNIQVVTNGTTDGISLTAFSSSYGIDILRDASHTDDALRIISPTGAFGQSVNIQSDDCNSILIDNTGTGSPIVAQHQTSAGIVLTPVPSGGVVGPSLNLNSTLSDPNDLSRGTIWNKEANGIQHLRTGHGTNSGYILSSRNAPCYASSSAITNFIMTGSQTNQVIAADFTYDPGMEPQQADNVLVKIWGKISLLPETDNIVELIVRDRTAGDVPICNIDINHEGAGPGISNQWSATYATVYNLPAAGARTFDFVWSGTIGQPNGGNFNGFIEITELRG